MEIELANLQLSFSSACQTIVSIEEKGTVLNRAFQSLNEINTEYQMLEHELVCIFKFQFHLEIYLFFGIWNLNLLGFFWCVCVNLKGGRINNTIR